MIDNLAPYLFGGALLFGVGVIVGSAIVGICWSSSYDPAQETDRLRKEAETKLVKAAIEQMRSKQP